MQWESGQTANSKYIYLDGEGDKKVFTADYTDHFNFANFAPLREDVFRVSMATKRRKMLKKWKSWMKKNSEQKQTKITKLTL